MVPAAAASTMAMIVRRVRIVLRSFGWWSWRWNALSNLNSLAREVRPVVRPWSPVKSVSVAWDRSGTARRPGSIGSLVPPDRPPLCPRGRNVAQACRLDRPVAAVGGGSRSYLVVYLDSLLIGELPDQVPEATWVALVSDPSEHGPAWARPPDTWPQLPPERPLRELLAERRSARRAGAGQAVAVEAGHLRWGW
jgi:hypothetical protein